MYMDILKDTSINIKIKNIMNSSINTSPPLKILWIKMHNIKFAAPVFCLFLSKRPIILYKMYHKNIKSKQH